MSSQESFRKSRKWAIARLFRGVGQARWLTLGALFFLLVAGIMGLNGHLGTLPFGSSSPQILAQAPAPADADKPGPAIKADPAAQKLQAQTPGARADADAGDPDLQLAATEPDSADAVPEQADQDFETRKGDDEDGPPQPAISGAVLDDQGSLLSGIRVTARPVAMPGADRRGPQSTAGPLAQVSDGLGSFTFEPLDEGEYQLAVAESEDHHSGHLRVRAGMLNAEMRLQRKRSVRVYGVVTDEFGDPLEGARVRPLGTRGGATSNPSGGYEIMAESLRAGQAPVLEFTHRDYREERRRVDAAVGPDVDEIRLDVQLESTAPKVALLGQVVGPKGEAVGGVRVWLSSSEPRTYRRTTSSEWGEFRIEAVEVGDAYRLGVEPGADYEAYASEPFAVGPGDATHDVRLEDAGYAGLSGRVVDPGGSPLGQFTLWLKSTDAGRHSPVPVRTDGAGRFEVEQIPSGVVRLETTSQPRLQAGGIALSPGETRHVEVPLDWGQRWMFGRIIDPEGKPVPQARITVQWSQRYYDITSSSRRQTFSDIEGFFTVANLGAFNYRVTVQAPGFRTVRRNHAPGADEFQIVLQPDSALAGGGS